MRASILRDPGPRSVELAKEFSVTRTRTGVRMEHPVTAAVLVSRKFGRELSLKPILAKRVCNEDGKPQIDILVGGLKRVYDETGLIKKVELPFSGLTLEYQTRKGAKTPSKVTVLYKGSEVLSASKTKGYDKYHVADLILKEPNFESTGVNIKAIDTSKVGDIRVLGNGTVFIKDYAGKNFVIINPVGDHIQYSNDQYEQAVAYISHSGELKYFADRKTVLVHDVINRAMASHPSPDRLAVASTNGKSALRLTRIT